MSFIGKFWATKNLNLRFTINAFLIWRVFLFALFFLAIPLFELQTKFLGGRLDEYILSPIFRAWTNFDGIHYISIAEFGYTPLRYFYFPLFPIAIRYVETFFSNYPESFFIASIVSANLFCIIALSGLYELVKLDWGIGFAKKVVIALLVFPTAFYFGAGYTESLFLALVVWCVYAARTKNWLIAVVLGFMATLTRFVGIALIPLVFIELLQERPRLQAIAKGLVVGGVIGLGFGLYMYFVYQKTGDPLELLTNVGSFGEQRSGNLIFLPQVFYRYFFKVLPNVNYLYLPSAFFSSLEILTGLGLTGLLMWGFNKLRLSYWAYFLVAFITPTLSGSFSSLPRYALVIFPVFILLVLLFDKIKHRLVKIAVVTISVCALSLAAMLFLRGYWIA